MHHQSDLFSSEIPDTHQQSASNPATALKLTEQDTQLSPSQQRFNRLLGRIDKLQAQLVEVQALRDAHRPVYHQSLAPLRERYRMSVREMVLLLDSRLQSKGLGIQQQTHCRHHSLQSQYAVDRTRGRGNESAARQAQQRKSGAEGTSCHDGHA